MNGFSNNAAFVLLSWGCKNIKTGCFMKLFNKVSVFKAGTHTDKNGFEKDWTAEELKEAAEKYNPDTDEVPVVVGHPAMNAPAFGWVKKLETDGVHLFADLELTDEFAELVEAGYFKKRSISINDDLTINHIGFLGAKKPAVKGLKDIQFSENKSSRVIEFMQNLSGGNEMEIKDMERKLHEQERENLTKDKTLVEKEQKISEFAEKNKTIENENKALKEKIQKIEREKRRAEFSAFCKDIECLAGDRCAAAIDFMEILDERGTYKFSEGGEKSAVEKFQEFLKGFPKTAEFSEFATRKAAHSAAGNTSDTKKKNEFSAPAGTNVDAEALAHFKRAKEYAEKNNVSFETAVMETL